MAGSGLENVRFERHVKSYWDAIWRDRVAIVLVAAVLALAGAVVGKVTNNASSTALLALTPMPMRSANQLDQMTRMIAAPLDVKTISLLCTSDDVLQKTREKLNSGGELSAPIKTLHQLKNSLSFEITITKETPYEIAYSPVLALIAEASNPTDARLKVNMWAETCVEAAQGLREKQHAPSNTAFRSEVSQALTALKGAEQELEEFRKENNLAYMQARRNMLVGVINEFEQKRADIEQSAMQQNARANALAADKETEQSAFKLKWTPSDRLLTAIEGRLGASIKAEDDTNGHALEVEHINDTYVRLSTESALARSHFAGYKAQMDRLDTDTTRLRNELDALQVRLSETETIEKRLLRDIAILETAYKDVAVKGEYTQIAQALKHPPVQLLSEGAEWEMPRFRRAILFGFAAGVLGLLCASCVSILARCLLYTRSASQ